MYRNIDKSSQHQTKVAGGAERKSQRKEFKDNILYYRI